MSTTAAARQNPLGRGRARAQEIDRYVGARMRERRLMLGLTQRQLAELIGVTYQQELKYEKGINRITAGRLFKSAEVLGVEIGYFFEGMDDERATKPTVQQRMQLDLARTFIALPNRKHQEALRDLARALAQPELAVAGGDDAGAPGDDPAP
jgi:transcriptional regulator with XRE-family HTH domain